ncbi:MAG: GIY-YIG nuclease family protein [Chloroflexi bacterium]|nr:GIY-YIG nuclease family protein [Chloroflexota bacterium]
MELGTKRTKKLNQTKIEAQDRFETENNLHRMLRKKRVKGEWFELDETDIESIETLARDSALLPSEEVTT